MTAPTAATCLLATGSVVLLGAAPVLGMLPAVAADTSSSAARTQVISNCVTPHYEPKRIILTCGDANSGLTHLHYARWSASRAEGAGRFVYDDCQPNCAAGHDHHFPVTVTLKRVRTHQGQPLFTRLVTKNTNGKTQTYHLPTSRE